jgi:hypothetical protein
MVFTRDKVSNGMTYFAQQDAVICIPVTFDLPLPIKFYVMNVRG